MLLFSGLIEDGENYLGNPGFNNTPAPSPTPQRYPVVANRRFNSLGILMNTALPMAATIVLDLVRNAVVLASVTIDDTYVPNTVALAPAFDVAMTAGESFDVRATMTGVSTARSITAALAVASP